jgi:CRP/FNR family transcriptional regulator, cyclic AMP receptor protein
MVLLYDFMVSESTNQKAFMTKYTHFLIETDLFYNLDPTQLKQIESLCEELKFKKGEIIFSENTREGELYLVENGLVEIMVNPDLVAPQERKSNKPSAIALLRRGQSFGEIALVDEGIRSASAIAREEKTRLLKITRTKFLELCKTNPELGYLVMYNLSVDLARKIRNADLQIREAMLYQQQAKDR